MKNIIVSFFAMLFFTAVTVGQTAEQQEAAAKGFMQKGDYSNAVLVLKNLHAAQPSNLAYAKELAQSYYYQGDNDRALEVIQPWVDKMDGDDQAYQIAGDVYKQKLDPKNAEATYRKGIKKFPDSGPLYNALGEFQLARKDFDAINTWKAGIMHDPGYSMNYYNAARFQYLTTDRIWSILYGEIFLNMDPHSANAPAMKEIMLESYKKFFTGTKDTKSKTPFEQEFIDEMTSLAPLVSGGVTTTSLTALRTKFIADWFTKSGSPAFHLFDVQRHLIKEGDFDAYNQWLFGAAENAAAYGKWLKSHSKEVDAFEAFQRNRVFTMPAGQFYESK